jgi:Zn-dependent peptidase ImmA (M78 family)
MSTNYHIQKEATHLRNQWEIGPTDPVRLPSLFLRLNTLVVFKKLNTKFSGMSYKVADFSFMLINSAHPIGRQNFTICHELYHIFVQTDFEIHSCIIEGFDKKNKNEYAADLFASFFLLPEDGVLRLIPENELKRNKITLQTILKIEQYYRCSRSALLYRLENLGLIYVKDYEEFRSDVSKNAKLYGLDTSLYHSGRHGLVYGEYGVLAKKLFDDEKISESHYLSLLKDIGIDIDDDNNGD